MCVIERMKKAVSLLLAMVLLLQYIPAPVFAEETPETGLCEHHAVHENCGYVAAVAGADCTHEHDDSCFTTKCAHVHGDCGYVAAVEGEEQKEEIPCEHSCAAEEACNEKVLNCAHVHSESCGYVEAVEGKACEFVCETCAAEEAAAAAVAEVKILIDALPEVETVQAMTLEEQKVAYEQTQAAYDAYGKLTEEQQQELADSEEVFKLLFDYFNTLIDADGEIGSGTPDGTPPVLNGLTISATEVPVLGTFEVIVDASDDVSGVSTVWVEFYCEETQKGIHGSLSGTYYDEETHEWVPYEDGKFHGTLTVGQYAETGVFKLSSVSLYDKAGNSKYYYDDILPDSLKNIQFTVVESTTPDGMPPVLNGLEIATTTVTAPGTLEVMVDASDDVSGVSTVWVEFYCEETQKGIHGSLSGTYYDEETHEWVPYEDGKFHGTLTVGQYAETGVFKLSSVSLYDKAGNSKYYYDDILPDSLKNIQFTVVESTTPDGMPPVLNGLEISTTTVTAPGTLKVIVDASDDVSGVSTVWVEFYCEETQKGIHGSLSGTYYDEETHEWVPYEDKKFHGTLTVGQYVETGVFKLSSVSLYDKAGNSQYYYDDILPESLKNIQFTVTNVGADITTSTNQSTFVEEVKNAANDAYIAADYSGNATMPQEAFDAIAGTDKTIDLISEGITWRFEGNDITKDTKPIDLSVQITKAEENTSADGEAIQDKLNGTTGVVMKFAENGTLPGKATIQVKVDYAMREYLGSDTGLCVYYYNNQTGELELVAQNLTVINDTYVEFEITHCSYYVLAAAAGTNEIIKGSCGNNLTWSLETATGILTISGTGEMTDFGYRNAPWYTEYQNNIRKVVVNEGVTTIGDGAFYNLDKVISISLPEGIVSIGDYSITACGSLTGLTLPESLVTLGVHGISNCHSLTSITIPAGVTSIGDSNFVVCGKLKTLSVDASNPNYCSINNVLYNKDCTELIRCPGGYTGKLEVPSGVTTIKEQAFWGDMKITDVIFPASVCSVGADAFTNCQGLKTVKFYGNGVVFGSEVFDTCQSLASVIFFGNVAVFGNRMFFQSTPTVYYPGDDTTWTSDVMQNYGGSVTWIPSYDSGVCGDNLTWTYEVVGGTLTITGSGDMYDYSPVTTPWRNYYISNVVFSGDITSIGEYAFSECEGLIQVSVPNTVKHLGTAFYKCPDLLRIDIPDSVTEISSIIAKECYRLETIWVNANNSSYSNDDDGILYNKDKTVLIQTPIATAKRVVVPDTVTRINNNAFEGCYNLESITLPAGLKEIGFEAFVGCTYLNSVIIPAQVTEIGYNAFGSCGYLRKVIFAGDAPQIGMNCFYKVSATVSYPSNEPGWTSAVMQNYGGDITWEPVGNSGSYGDTFNWSFDETTGTLTITGEGILYANSNNYFPWYTYADQIKTVVIEDGVTVLGENMFTISSNLTQVTLPGTVTAISYNAFSDCTNLQSVSIPKSVESIHESAFENCTNLTEIVIPDSVQIIKEEAFRNCSSLSQVTLPESVTEIAYATFADCSGLTEIDIPGSVTSIVYNAFDGCSSLEKVTISGTVTNVAYDAFANCNSLTTVTLSTDPASITDGAFRNCNNLTTVVLSENVITMNANAMIPFPNVTTIKFTGDAPTFDSNAFQGVTATAYYPADKAGWTSDVLQNYGGNITWIAVNNGSGDSGSGSTPVAPPASGGTDTGAGGTTTGNTTRPTTPVRPTVPTDTVTDVIVIEKTDMDAAIDAAGNAGHTEVEISAEDKGDGKTVSLPVESLEEITDADLSLSVVTKDATITFDTEALDAIVQQAGGKEIQLQYQEIKEAKLNNQQKKAIKDQLSDHKGQKHVLTFTVELTGDGEKIHDFRGGTATIRIPFELPKGTKAEDYAVFYLNSNGEIERYETTYDGKYLIVQLKHFSEYAVVYEPDIAETEPTEAVPEIAAAEVSAVAAASETAEAQAPSGVQIPIWLILMVVALLCVIALIFILRKRF